MSAMTMQDEVSMPLLKDVGINQFSRLSGEVCETQNLFLTKFFRILTLLTSAKFYSTHNNRPLIGE